MCKTNQHKKRNISGFVESVWCLLGFLRTLLSYLTLRSLTHCPPPSLGWCACAPLVLWLGAGAGRHLRHPGLRAPGGRHHHLPPALLPHVHVGEAGLSVEGADGWIGKYGGQHPEWHQPLASQQARSVLHLFLIWAEIWLALPSFISLYFLATNLTNHIRRMKKIFLSGKASPELTAIADPSNFTNHELETPASFVETIHWEPMCIKNILVCPIHITITLMPSFPKHK